MAWRTNWPSRLPPIELFASATSAGPWLWSAVGILALCGGLMYLLPSFADRAQSGERRLPDDATAHPGANAILASDRGPVIPLLSSLRTWQNVPLLATQGPFDATADGEVRVLSLQSALKRESDRATEAEQRIADLQEQLGKLKDSQNEKVEEITVLREQLAESRTEPSPVAEQHDAAAEAEKTADDSPSRIAALQKELANSDANLLEARKMAESEKAKADLALEQLKAMERQVAALAASEAVRADKVSRPLPKDDHVMEVSLPESLDEKSPAGRAPPLPRPADGAPSDPPAQDKAAAARNRPDGLPKSGARVPVGRDSASGPVPAPRRGSVIQRETPSTKLSRTTTEPGPRLLGQVSSNEYRRPRSATSEPQNPRGPVALQLPRALLPDSRLW